MNEKDKNKRRKSSSPKSKGFYVALYSCIGVMLAIAVVVGYMNMTGSDTKQDKLSSAENNPQVAAVDKSKDGQQYEDYLGEISTAITGEYNDELAKKPKATSGTSSEATPAPSTAPSASPKAKAEEQVPAQTQEEKPKTDTPTQNEDNEANNDVNKSETIGANESEPFAAFDGAQTLVWPVVGEIVMPFSMDKLVYDTTLEQYRINNNICIAAPSGTQVHVAAEGIVKEVTQTKESGNTVVVDHGNGWVTTYSQLQDGILVSVGDVVKASDIIGGVADPSIYSVLLGSHLQFEITKDGQAMDPNTLLASN